MSFLLSRGVPLLHVPASVIARDAQRAADTRRTYPSLIDVDSIVQEILEDTAHFGRIFVARLSSNAMTIGILKDSGVARIVQKTPFGSGLAATQASLAILSRLNRHGIPYGQHENEYAILIDLSLSPE